MYNSGHLLYLKFTRLELPVSSGHEQYKDNIFIKCTLRCVLKSLGNHQLNELEIGELGLSIFCFVALKYLIAYTCIPQPPVTES